MFWVEISIKNVDYDLIVSHFIPKLTEKLTQQRNSSAQLLVPPLIFLSKTLLKILPQSIKEDIIVKIIEQNSAKIVKALNDYIDENHIGIEINKIYIRMK